MKQKIVYVAADGSSFDDAEDCAEYEYIHERLEAVRQGEDIPEEIKLIATHLYGYIPSKSDTSEYQLQVVRGLKALVEYLYQAKLD